MKTLVLTLGILFSNSLTAQSGKVKCFWITFSDKIHTIYKVDNPAVFLSERAILRRSKQNIPITESDFPVNANYLAALKKKGAIIKFSSRWFNAVAVVCTEAVAQEIAAQPFVTQVDYAGKYFPKLKHLAKNKTKRKRVKAEFKHQYGYAKEQIDMLNGITLHEQGLTGRGQMIAVLDAGFKNVEVSPFFAHLLQNDRLMTYDAIDGDKNVFESSLHGTQVLSVMAANIPGVMVGTAPDATYICIKTEDNRGEFRMDECSWIAGLEYADSIGVDVVNSSLGYTTFDDRRMNYHIADLDGKTSLTSRAAEIAFAKGMIIVSSAGNEGKNVWKGLAMPADAPNVLAVGAVDYYHNKCDFSSSGWVKNEGVKPDVVALGIDVAVISGEKNKVLSGRGTSYAAPLISGLIAALWQAFPEMTNQQIMEAVRKSASDALHPSIETGFGVPNFSAAFNYLQMKQRKKDVWATK